MLLLMNVSLSGEQGREFKTHWMGIFTNDMFVTRVNIYTNIWVLLEGFNFFFFKCMVKKP